MLPGYNYYNRDFYLHSSREPLRIVNQEKDLGVIFDEKLSFSIHITEPVNTANRIMGDIRRSFTDQNSDNFRNLFTTMISPHGRCMVTLYEKRHSTNRKCAANGHQTTARNFYPTTRDLDNLIYPP